MKRFRIVCLISLFGLISICANAQSEVTSTNMLYNAPYRHFINPAFEPLTEGYLYLPALSHLSIYAGNNSFSLNNLVINKGGVSMWTLNPNSGVNIMDAFRQNTLIDANANIALLGFGWRTKRGGYLHINLNERVDAGVTLPRDLFQFALGGGMTDLENGNFFNLKSLGVQAQLYSEFSVGYSRKEAEIWTWGLKVKFLMGHAYAGMNNKNLNLYAQPEEWSLQGNGAIRLAAPLTAYPTDLNADNLFNGGFDWKGNLSISAPTLFNGFGGAFDLGFTVRPVKYVTLSAALTDIGLIYWHRGREYSYAVDGTFSGMGAINYADYKDAQGNFDSKQLGDTLSARFKEVYTHALTSTPGRAGFLAPLTMKLNVSAEVNLANDIVGLGVYSKTMLYNSRLYEEVTFGASVRPASWFNFGVSYSFLNGKWSNVGVGLGLRGGPLVLTLAADYVPTTYAALNGKNVLPYKTQGINFEMGLGIVWGWKKKAAEAQKTTTPAKEEVVL